MKRLKLWVVVAVVVLGTPAVWGAASLPMGDQMVGDCGETTHGAGCSNSVCESCVCAGEPSCCSDDWDNDCLFEASNTCPAECFAVVGDCGSPHAGSGCSDAVCEACVCENFLNGQCCADDEDWGTVCTQAAVGILFDDQTCTTACLTSVRQQKAPALSPFGLVGLLGVFGVVAWRRIRAS